MNAFTLFAQNNSGDAAPALLRGALLLGLICIGLAVYFLPAFIAGMRGHQNAAAIFVLNLLLGWTFLGWAAALVWAFTAIERRGPRRRYDYEE